MLSKLIDRFQNWIHQPLHYQFYLHYVILFAVVHDKTGIPQSNKFTIYHPNRRQPIQCSKLKIKDKIDLHNRKYKITKNQQ